MIGRVSRFLRSPASRYWTMQMFLCLVLGGTLLLAAFVRHRITERDVRFETAAEFGPFLLQRPVRWTERYTQDGVIFEELSSRGRPRRRVEIWTAFTPVFVSPVEFLARSEDPRLRDTAALLGGASPDALRRATAPLLLGGWNGVLLSQDRLVRGGDGAAAVEPTAATWRTAIGCALLPSGRVLLMRLDGEMLQAGGAKHVLRTMGRTLRLLRPKFPVSGTALPLDDWSTLTVPARFSTFAAREDVRVSRLLIANDPEQHWLGVDVVPCLARPRDGAAEALPSLMTMRDPLFRAGDVEQIDEQTWMCRRASDDGRHPGAVFWRELGGGRAVLAEFRWVGTDDPEQEEIRVREAWGQIVENLDAPSTPVPSEMIARGLAVGRHLPTDAAFLLERAEPVERWQWYHEALSRQTETVFRYGQDEGVIRGAWGSERSPPLSASGGGEQGWFWLGRNWNHYRCVVARDDAGVLSQISRMARGRLRTVVMAGRERVEEREVSIDASFVPGSVFMLVLGALPAEPMVLTTDWLINPTGGASANRLTLVLRPVTGMGAGVSSGSGQTGSGGRLWEVRINGRSFASRWQLDEEGRVESVTFGGDVRLRRVKVVEEGEGREAEKAEGPGR